MLGILLLLAGCATWDYAYTPDQAAFTQQLITQAGYDQQQAIQAQANNGYAMLNQRANDYQAQQQLNN